MIFFAEFLPFGVNFVQIVKKRELKIPFQALQNLVTTPCGGARADKTFNAHSSVEQF
jgi:hypothetical protein